MISAKEFTDIMEDLVEEKGGRFHRDEAIEHLARETELTVEQASKLVLGTIEQEGKFNERGFAKLDEEEMQDLNTAHLDDEITEITMTPGPVTGESYYELPVLDQPDESHPLIPDEDEYIERTLPHATETTDATDVKALCSAMADPDFSPLLVGDAGTGKDTLVRHVCSVTNRPVVRVNFGSNIRYEDLVGMYTLNQDQEMVWRDGYLTSAVRYGWVFIADELNAAPPESTMPLHQVTEERGKASLVLRTKSEIIEPHPQFRFVATMNPDYHGTNQLNDAFKSRFYTIEIDYLDRENEVDLIDGKINDGETVVPRAKIETLCEIAHELRRRRQRSDIMTPVTTRELLKICKLSDIMSLEEATKTILLGHVKTGDESLVEDLIDEHRFR